MMKEFNKVDLKDYLFHYSINSINFLSIADKI